MSFSASRTTQGFELVGNLSGVADNGTKWEMTPSLAVVAGDMLILTNNKVAAAVASSSNILGVAAETKTADDTDVTYLLVYTHPDNIYECSCSDMHDNTVDSATTTTIVDAELTMSADDDCNGARLYIYEGTNAGLVRTVSDFDESDDTITFTDPLPVACDTTSKYLLYGECDDPGTTPSVINIGTPGVNLKDCNTIDADAAVDAVDGPLLCLGFDDANAIMRVKIIKSLFDSR